MAGARVERQRDAPATRTAAQLRRYVVRVVEAVTCTARTEDGHDEAGKDIRYGRSVAHRGSDCSAGHSRLKKQCSDDRRFFRALYPRSSNGTERLRLSAPLYDLRSTADV